MELLYSGRGKTKRTLSRVGPVTTEAISMVVMKAMKTCSSPKVGILKVTQDINFCLVLPVFSPYLLSLVPGSLPEKFLTMLKLLHRVLRFMSSHFCFISYKKMLLAAFMLYLVVVRLDPGMGLRLQHVTCHLLWLWIKNQKLLEMGFIHASLIRIWYRSGVYVAALSYPQFLSELLPWNV